LCFDTDRRCALEGVAAKRADDRFGGLVVAVRALLDVRPATTRAAVSLRRGYRMNNRSRGSKCARR
jgi:hypothetical protein